MKEELVLNKNFVSSVLPLSPFPGLVGGEGLYDSQTKLVRFGARDYDAEVGRWTCKDPIGFGGESTNFYSYLKNNPLVLVDPFGLYTFSYSRTTTSFSILDQLVFDSHYIVYEPSIIFRTVDNGDGTYSVDFDIFQQAKIESSWLSNEYELGHEETYLSRLENFLDEYLDPCEKKKFGNKEEAEKYAVETRKKILEEIHNLAKQQHWHLDWFDFLFHLF